MRNDFRACDTDWQILDFFFSERYLDWIEVSMQ